MYKIYPKPKQIIIGPGVFNKLINKVYFEQLDQRLVDELQKIFPFILGNEQESLLRFYSKVGLAREAYEIVVSEDKITAYASNVAGFFYAIKTLKQIYKAEMECVKIIDEPDLALRGFMMDISRNKVPTLKTIKEVLDLMS